MTLAERDRIEEIRALVNTPEIESIHTRFAGELLDIIDRLQAEPDPAPVATTKSGPTKTCPVCGRQRSLVDVLVLGEPCLCSTHEKAAPIERLRKEYEDACARHGGGPSAECTARWEELQAAEEQAKNALVESAPEVETMEHYRCFHCKKVFGPNIARDHFGTRSDVTACRDSERNLSLRRERDVKDAEIARLKAELAEAREISNARATSLQMTSRFLADSKAELARVTAELDAFSKAASDWAVMLEAAEADARKMREALESFAKFADAFDAKPINGLDRECIYAIHGGEGCEFGASIKWEHITQARAALAPANS